MKVRKLLEIQSTFEDSKVPCDMNGELNKHYSESKKKEIDILDMDLIHLVRSFSKSIGQGITDKELLEEKLKSVSRIIKSAKDLLSE